MSKSSTLETLIEAYARAKGVTLKAGYTGVDDENVFEKINIAASRDKIVGSDLMTDVKLTGDPDKPISLNIFTGGELPFRINLLGKFFKFNNFKTLKEVLNAARNPRVVGQIRKQIDGKIIRYFDATNTEVHTIYAAESESQLKEICVAFGSTSDECAMVLAHCAETDFGNECKVNIKNNRGNFTFQSDEKDERKLIQAYAFLKKLGWKVNNDGVVDSVEEWAKTDIAKSFKNSDGAIDPKLGGPNGPLDNMVKALNASNIMSNFIKKQCSSPKGSPLNMEEIKKAIVEGRFSKYRFFTPFGPFGYPLRSMPGGANEKASDKLQKQFDTLKNILNSVNKKLHKDTENQIETELKALGQAETALDKAVKDLTESLDLAAKDVVAKRDGLNVPELQLGTNTNKTSFLNDFTRAYEKVQVGVMKIANALNNAYVVFTTKNVPKAADVTAAKTGRTGPTPMTYKMFFP